VHTGRTRRGRPRSRILYWFRTPPGVRVGRAALDEEAIRLIEEHNPDVEFDWTRILKGQGSPEPPTAQPPQVLPQKPRERLPRAATIEAGQPPIEDTVALQVPEIVDLAEPALESVPADDEAAPEMDGPVGAALARLGSEGMSRLRARHAEVLARISEKTTDQMRRDELKTEADRLNPDTWVTEAEVTAGIEQYETVFESLRGVLGRRRKRRRRRGDGSSATSGGGQDVVAADSPAESDPGGANDVEDDL
jgi:hypothetical protein